MCRGEHVDCELEIDWWMDERLREWGDEYCRMEREMEQKDD